MSRTLLDVQLAHLLYPLLIEVAESQGILTYTQLIEQARATHFRDVPVRSTAFFDEAGAYCLSAGYRPGAVPRSLNGVEYEF